MPSDLIWDISVEKPSDACYKKIYASEEMFRFVAGTLLKIATEKPDKRLSSELMRDLESNYDFQASLFSFALQLFSDRICPEGGGMRLRQKSDFPCIWQQEQEPDVWVDIFDMSLCMSVITDSIQEIGGMIASQNMGDYLPFALDLMTEYEDKYTGTSASFSPELILNGDDPVLARAALCETIKQQIVDMAQVSLKYKEDEAEAVDRASLLLGVGVAVVGILAALASIGTFGASLAAFTLWAGGLGFGVVGAAAAGTAGLTVAGLQLWAQTTKDTAEAVFEDELSIDELACLWFNQLKENADISQTIYATEIDLSEAEQENTVALYAALKPLIEQELTYAAFLKLWQRNIQIGLAGISSTCECDPDVPEIVMINYGPTWGSTTITYVGKSFEGWDIWELYLAAEGMNGGDSMWQALFETSMFRPKNVQVLSGAINTGTSGTNMGGMTSGQFDPDTSVQWFILSVTSFPCRVRVTVDASP